MYIESYWLLYSNRENTWNGLRGSNKVKPIWSKRNILQIQLSKYFLIISNT